MSLYTYSPDYTSGNTQGFLHFLTLRGVRKPGYYLDTVKRIEARCPLSAEAVHDFLDSLILNGMKASSVNKYLSVIKAYGRFKKWEWVEDLKKYPEKKSRIGLLSDKEIEAFLALPCPPRTPKLMWAEATMFWEICAYCGVRMGEAAKLEAHDIDLATNNLLLWDTKTDQPRRVPIPTILRPKLITYLETHDSLLFSSHRTDAVSPYIDAKTWYRQFKRRLELLGIKRPFLRPYSVRHSYATDAYENGCPLERLARLLGHKDIRQTLHYAQLSNKDLQEVKDIGTLAQHAAPTRDLFKHLIKDVQANTILERAEIDWYISNNELRVRLKDATLEESEKQISGSSPATRTLSPSP